MLPLPIWVQQMRGFHADQTKLALDAAHQAFASGEVVAVGYDRAINPDPRGDDVQMVAVADQHVAVEAHALGPCLTGLRPLVAGQRPVAWRQPQAGVADCDPELRPQPAQGAELGCQLAGRLPGHRPADDLDRLAWSLLGVH